MKILRISTRNFRLHAASDVTFPPTGVTGIIGANEAGKSTILEAAVWALFGSDTTRGTKASLRWHRAPARRLAAVTLEFEVGGREYRIDRDENSAQLSTSGRAISSTTSGVNAHVPELLGMTHGEFSASYLCRQKDVARLATMGDTERVAFIRGVLGMGRIDQALKTCRARKGELSSERDGLAAGLGQREPLEETRRRAQADVEHAEHAAETREAERRIAASAHEAATAALAASSTRKADHDRLVRERQDARNAWDAAALEIQRLEARLAAQEAAEARLRDAAPELARIPSLRAERDQLVAARGAAGERATLTTRVEQLGRELVELERDIASAETVVALHMPAELERAQARARDLDGRLSDLKTERGLRRAQELAAAEAAQKDGQRHARRLAAIEAAGAEGACPTCTRALGEHFAAVVAELQEELRKALEAEGEHRRTSSMLRDPSDEEIEAGLALDESRREVERLIAIAGDARTAGQIIEQDRRRLTAGRAEIHSARERLARLPTGIFLPSDLIVVEQALTRLEALDRSLADARGLASQVDDTHAALAERRERLARADQALQLAVAALQGITFDAAAHTRLEDASGRARQAAEDARVAMARAEEAERGALARRSDAELALEDYDGRAARLQAVAADHHVHERTAARLADFRVAIASTIRPELEELMSGFVHLLTDGRHEAVTLDEHFAATLHEAGVPTEVVSGGTEDVTALAMRLAISQMIAERAGHPLSLLILDEPFGSLDETRRGNVLTLIRRLRGVFQQVVIISHVAETRDAVDHVIELEFDEGAGMTRVVGAPAALERAS